MVTAAGVKCGTSDARPGWN